MASEYDNMTAEELKEVARQKVLTRAKGDLYWLNHDILRPEGGYELGEMHQRLCSFIEGKDRRKMVQIARGHFKTTMVTEGYTIQRILQNPEIRVLLVNVKLDNAKAFLRKIKTHFEMNESFRWIAQDLLPKKTDKWTETEIIVKRKRAYQEATVEAIGVGGTLVSKHYDLIIYDDVVNDENTATKEQIEKLLDWFRASLSLLEPDGEIIVIGTRWHFNDLYGYIEEHMPEYKTLKLGCTVGNVPIDTDGAEPSFPGRFTIEYLKQLRQEQGSYVFNAQYMMEPIDDSNATFKREWFRYYEQEDLKGLDLRTYMTIDPAISLKDSSDYSAICVTSVDEWNNVYVREIKYGHWQPNELLENVFLLYGYFKPIRIGMEMVAFQRSLKYSIQDMMREKNIFLPLTELKTSTTTSKEMRIRGLQPRFENGAVRLKKGMDELEEELLRFPKAKRDDLLDALAYGMQLWTVPQGIFKKKAHRDRRQQSGWTALEPLTGY